VRCVCVCVCVFALTLVACAHLSCLCEASVATLPREIFNEVITLKIITISTSSRVPPRLYTTDAETRWRWIYITHQWHYLDMHVAYYYYTHNKFYRLSYPRRYSAAARRRHPTYIIITYYVFDILLLQYNIIIILSFYGSNYIIARDITGVRSALHRCIINIMAIFAPCVKRALKLKSRNCAFYVVPRQSGRGRGRNHRVGKHLAIFYAPVESF